MLSVHPKMVASPPGDILSFCVAFTDNVLTPDLLLFREEDSDFDPLRGAEVFNFEEIWRPQERSSQLGRTQKRRDGSHNGQREEEVDRRSCVDDGIEVKCATGHLLGMLLSFCEEY